MIGGSHKFTNISFHINSCNKQPSSTRAMHSFILPFHKLVKAIVMVMVLIFDISLTDYTYILSTLYMPAWWVREDVYERSYSLSFMHGADLCASYAAVPTFIGACSVIDPLPSIDTLASCDWVIGYVN